VTEFVSFRCASMINGDSVSRGVLLGLRTLKLSMITERKVMNKRNKMRPIHPGEVLLEEFMKPSQLSANRLAEGLLVPANRISGIVKGERSITADTALRLGRYFGTTPELWLNMQATYELRLAATASAKDIANIVPARRSA
jgi:antitoxin HigA-1